MHKYSLTFKDNQLEDRYQKSIMLYKRQSTFKLVNYALLALAILKLIEAIYNSQIKYFIFNLVLMLQMIIQCCLIEKKKKYLRLAIFVTNHTCNMYAIICLDETQNQIAMMQGINQMSLTFILLLIGEYIEGVVTVFDLTIFRIAWVLIHDSNINWSIIVAQLFLLFFINYFILQFHRGRRHQFLLTLVDSNYEAIFNKLAMDRPFILLQYEENSLHFTIKQENNCNFFENEQADHFLKNSSINNQQFQSFMKQQIHQYQRNILDNYNHNFILKYNRKSLLIDLSIYQGEKPCILLIFKEFNTQKINKELYYKKTNQLTKLLVQALNSLERLAVDKQKYMTIKRKVLMINLFENIEKEKVGKSITPQQVIKIIKKFCIGYQLNIMFYQVKEIITFPKLLLLVVLIIFDNETSHSLIIKLKYCQQFEIHLDGQFELESIQTLLQPIKHRLYLIFSEISLNKKNVTLFLNNEINIPF